MAQLLPHALGLGILLCLSAFFSGSETALCALSRVQAERLRTDSKKSSRAICGFLDDPSRLFITVLLGNTLVNIAFATVTASLIYQLLGAGPSGLAILVATVIITLLLLVFGEITPKTLAIRHAEGFSKVTARVLWGFSVLIYPLRSVLRAVTDLLLPLFGGTPGAQAERITPEDFQAMVDGYDPSTLHADERETLGRVLTLREIQAREIIVPRTQMVCMNTTARIGDVLDRARESGHSRIPLYREKIDNICGIFHVKDWLHFRHLGIRDETLDEFLAKRHRFQVPRAHDLLVRPPFFATETRKIADLLAELTRRRTKLSIILDEYGGVLGCLTIEDIVEEVVGDIVDERDGSPPRPGIVTRADDPSVIEVAGRISLRHLNRQLRLNLDEKVADTIGGYLIGLLGHIPKVGEAAVDEHGIRLEVGALLGNHVAVVIIALPAEGDENE